MGDAVSHAKNLNYPDPADYDNTPAFCPYCMDARHQVPTMTWCLRHTHLLGEQSGDPTKGTP